MKKQTCKECAESLIRDIASEPDHAAKNAFWLAARRFLIYGGFNPAEIDKITGTRPHTITPPTEGNQ